MRPGTPFPVGLRSRACAVRAAGRGGGGAGQRRFPSALAAAFTERGGGPGPARPRGTMDPAEAVLQEKALKFMVRGRGGWRRRRGRVGTSVCGGAAGGGEMERGAMGKGTRASGLGWAGPGRGVPGWRAGEGGERGPGRRRPACWEGTERGPQIREKGALGREGGGCRCHLGAGEVKLE